MKTVYVVTQTNIWHGDPEYVLTGSTLGKAINLIKTIPDLVKNVKNKDSHIIIDEVTLNEIDGERRVFDTSNEDDRYLLISKKDIEKSIISLIKKRLPKVKMIKGSDGILFTTHEDNYDALNHLQTTIVNSHYHDLNSTNMEFNDKEIELTVELN